MTFSPHGSGSPRCSHGRSPFFHLCNGIRHLFWDAGYGFDLQAIYASGWAVVAISIGLTLTAWIISFGTKG